MSRKVGGTGAFDETRGRWTVDGGRWTVAQRVGRFDVPTVYTRCLFCSTRLGANGSIEHLPVGREVAYDLDRGRLWVVCPRCRRWNLCPFDERWEALEECERLAERCLVETAGEELSLLRHASGLRLIRIGRPALAELVSWRFARRVVRRRRRQLMVSAATLGLAGMVSFNPVVATGGLAAIVMGYGLGRTVRDRVHALATIETTAGERVAVTPAAARWARFRRVESGGPALVLGHARPEADTAPSLVLEGPDISHFLARAMPYVNQDGAPERAAVEAAALIHADGGSEAFLAAVAETRAEREEVRRQVTGTYGGPGLAALPRTLRLALEAASHTEQEDRALSGALAGVIAEWREAERIAEIADGLLDPPGSDGLGSSGSTRSTGESGP